MTQRLLRLIGLVSGLALILLALASGGVVAVAFWDWLLPPEPQPVAVRGPVATSTQEPAPGLSEQLDAPAWFGGVPAARPTPPPAAPRPAPAPDPEPESEQALPYRLQGVMAASDPGLGSALIAPEQSATAELFRVGDPVFEQARLTAVYPDYVVLARAGSQQRLYFGEAENAAAKAASASAPDSRATNPTRPEAPTAARSSGSSGGSAAGRARADRAERTEQATTRSSAPKNAVQARLEEEILQAMDAVRQRVDTDPYGLLRQYGLEARGDSYRVTPRAGILIANGLRPGDRITEINDRPVGDVERDLALVDSVMNSDEIKITLERGGATYRIYQALPDRN